MNTYKSEFLHSNANKWYETVKQWNDKQKQRLNTRDYQYYQTEVHKVVFEDLETDFNNFKEQLKTDFLNRYLPKPKKALDKSIIDTLISHLQIAKFTNGNVSEILKAFKESHENYDLTPLKAIVGDEYKPLFFNELNAKIERVNELAQYFDKQNIFTFVKVNEFFLLEIEEQPTNNYDLLNVLQRIANDEIFK